MNETLDYVRTFAVFPLALRRFLAAGQLSLEHARQIVRGRAEHREENFLAMVERGVYAAPHSPYLPLLRHAGCELGDLRAQVKRDGLEGTLRKLREAGVYVTFEEFKGRKPIQRGSLHLPVTAHDFDNPAAYNAFTHRTGGSTGASTSVATDLSFIAARAAHRLIVLEAHGLRGAPTALWRGMLPDGGLRALMRGVYLGNIPRRWFSPIGWRDSRHWLKYGVASSYLILWLRLAGARVPWPETVRAERAIEVARWLAETTRVHGRALLATNVSRGTRVCLAAMEAGLDLTGASIMGGGEPATPAKVRQMNQAGAKYISNYGMVESSTIGSGCAQPADGSDVHLFTDGFALFSHAHPIDGFDVSVPAFNLTAFLPGAPKVMLNVQADDYGIVEERHCGCPLESFGFTTHLRQIRSYAKLTGEGVTLIGTEMVRILEETLPARFGGSPLDYQLMEEEDEQGLTRLCLIVHPSVGVADEGEVIACLLDALRQSSPMADAARMLWQNSSSIQVRRMAPVWTGRGKLMPLHLPRRSAH